MDRLVPLSGEFQRIGWDEATDLVATQLTRVRERFFEVPHPKRSEKHFSDPSRGSAAKRLNMFLRWMVRPAETGVDFGIWKQLRSAFNPP